jgi:hypothetical protein
MASNQLCSGVRTVRAVRTSSDLRAAVDGGVPVEELDDDPVGIANLEGALAPLLFGQRHADGHTRVGTAAGAAHRSAHDPAHAYRFEMHRILDGLAALIDNRRIPPVPKIVESES